MSIPVEDLTSSLVREFLHKKKCVQTLKLLDEEWPRTEGSISSRAKLAEALHIETWVSQNKSTKPGFKTMLEVILYNIVQMHDLNKKVISPASTVSNDVFKKNSNSFHDDTDTASKLLDRPFTADAKMQQRSTKNDSAKSAFAPNVNKGFSDNQNDEVDILFLSEVATSSGFSRHLNSTDKALVQGDGSLFTKRKSSHQNVSNAASDFHSTALDELLSIVPEKKSQNSIETLNVRKSQSVFNSGSTKINKSHHLRDKPTISSNVAFDYDVAKALRTLIFGSPKVAFVSEWSDQNFLFSDCNDRPKKLRFGITQKRGGPCGVLASVQATVLKHMLFGNHAKSQTESCLNVGDANRTKCLANAITEMVWRAGQSSQATLAVMTLRKQFTSSLHEYRPDGVTEFVATLNFNSKSDLHTSVCENISSYEKGKGACILLLYSAILSRGIDAVIKDMDEPEGKLMGAHNYCTQEMVNLLLTGRATSNAFDNSIQLDKLTLLKGVHAQSEIGLLSLFEHYGSCKIGDFFKTPKYPIWLVCSESHFTVLFCLDLNLISNNSNTPVFDLYYYDGLANQDEVIKLTIDTTTTVSDRDLTHDLTPPLEHCIRTKWPKVFISWNDTEPLL